MTRLGTLCIQVALGGSMGYFGEFSECLDSHAWYECAGAAGTAIVGDTVGGIGSAVRDITGGVGSAVEDVGAGAKNAATGIGWGIPAVVLGVVVLLAMAPDVRGAVVKAVG